MTLTLLLAGCGGGGSSGTEVASTPPPLPTPPPSTAYSVRIFAQPKAETYASVGIAGAYSTADEAQPHIRYNGSYYEIQLPGKSFEPLIFYKGAIPQDPNTFNFFQPASAKQNEGYLITELAKEKGYLYSEMGVWGSLEGGGSLAFGSPTSKAGVPTTGTATMSGLVSGASDLLQQDNLVGGNVAVGVRGTVNLSFDFGAGTLAGAVALSTDPYVGPVDLGTFAFKNVVYSKGSPTYSGVFDTPASGINFFLGRLTGPNGEETIGAWALPFIYSVDGQKHQASGAWIAKR